MTNLIPLMCKVDDLKILHNLEDVVFMIADEEYPQNWGFVRDQIGEQIVSQNEQTLYAALCALKGIVKKYKTVVNLSRVHLNEICEKVYPLLEDIVQNIINSTDDKNLLLMIVIIKIFYLSNYVVIPLILSI